MKSAVMQPYIFPYLGYFQLINAVNKFVIYDKIKYTKKGWMNRNRILLNGESKVFTIPLKNDNDSLNVNQRYLSDNSKLKIRKILSQISNAYREAPFFKKVFPVIEKIFTNEEKNLFGFIYYSVIELSKLLDIKTQIIISSEIDINHDLKSEQKVIEIAKALNSDKYINAIGGRDLYDKEKFSRDGIKLFFLKSNPICYTQFENEFVPDLSVIDVLMFNDIPKVKEFLNEYELV